MQILKVAYDKAVELLKENRECLDRIADFLIEKETITGKEFMKIFREVKGIPEPEENSRNPVRRVWQRPHRLLKRKPMKQRWKIQYFE